MGKKFQRYLVRALILLLVGPVSKIAEAGGAAVLHRMPELRIDSSPVTSGRTPSVASYADVLEPMQQTVVSIFTSKVVKQSVLADPLLRQFFKDFPDQEPAEKQQGLGSGVIVSADGYILTNNHVVEGADELKVLLTDDREFSAKVIGTDPKTDVAVIKIEVENLAFITLADSDKIRVGDVVFAVGNPLNVGQTVTMGIVSAKGRSRLGLLENVGGYENFIQTDAAINMGNSGGALVDAKGRLIGVNSAIISPSRGSIGIGFAIPANFAANVMRSLIETGTVTRGYLGIGSETLTSDVAEQLGLPQDIKGVVITDILPSGPAEKSGLKISDVILSLNDRPVSSLEASRLVIAGMLPGSKVNLRLIREGKERRVEVTLAELAEKPNELVSGVTVGPLSVDLRRQSLLDSQTTGVVITDVEENSAHRTRLAVGMIIVEINQNAVSDVSSAKRALILPGKNLLRIKYRGAYSIVTLSLK